MTKEMLETEVTTCLLSREERDRNKKKTGAGKCEKESHTMTLIHEWLSSVGGYNWYSARYLKTARRISYICWGWRYVEYAYWPCWWRFAG